MRPEEVPETLVDLGDRAVADDNHSDLCACVKWPQACVSGLHPDDFTVPRAPVFLAAVLPTHREQVAQEVLAALAEAQRITGGNVVLSEGFRRAQVVVRRTLGLPLEE